MQDGLLSDCVRFLQFRPDALRNGSILLCLLLLLGGVLLLGIRLRAAGKRSGTPPSLVACRMTAVLGALGGFVVYLRDLPRPGAGFGLALGGVSALPWAAVVVLEAARKRFGSGREGDPPGRAG